MRIKTDVPFIPEARLEQRATRLIDRYHRLIEPVTAPPVPVEKIADFLLELGIEWTPIPDTDDDPILAYLHPASKTIRFNERRQPYFETYRGTYEFTLAHEIGHFELHLLGDDAVPPSPEGAHLCRSRAAATDRREWQAERFAGYLLMPAHLLLPKIEAIDLFRWPNLYRLRDRFGVSITALRIRLENLGRLYVDAHGNLHPPAHIAGDRRRDALYWANRGSLYRAANEPDRAAACYRQALIAARRLGDRRQEAFCAWNLGLLLEAADPAKAAALMSICVAYERDTGHPDADADARRVARLRASR